MLYYMTRWYRGVVQSCQTIRFHCFWWPPTTSKNSACPVPIYTGRSRWSVPLWCENPSWRWISSKLCWWSCEWPTLMSAWPWVLVDWETVSRTSISLHLNRGFIAPPSSRHPSGLWGGSIFVVVSGSVFLVGISPSQVGPPQTRRQKTPKQTISLK